MVGAFECEEEEGEVGNGKTELSALFLGQSAVGNAEQLTAEQLSALRTVLCLVYFGVTLLRSLGALVD